MRYVDIITAQKVEITYPLAGPWLRIAAFFIDLIILAITFLTVSFIISRIITDEIFDSILYFVIIFPLTLFFSLIWEVVLNGQTLGKKILQIRVMKLNGGEAAFFDYAIRWAFRPIDIWMSAGTIAITLVNASSKRQRLGDMLAGTVVIKKKSDIQYTLKDVLRLEAINDYNVTYPLATRFNDDQMLMIREVINRTRLYNNEAHLTLMYEVAEKAKEIMELDDMPEYQDEFLKKLLKDYVYLTR
jgi:uncharacterized RDD family membrane protein YckC